MKKSRLIIILIALLIFLSGCATVSKAKMSYWTGEHYEKIFGSDAETVFNVTAQALKELGWEINEDKTVIVSKKRVYARIYTKRRTFFAILFGGDVGLKCVIRPITANQTGVEIHYGKHTGYAPFFDCGPYSKRNDQYVNRVYSQIDTLLK